MDSVLRFLGGFVLGACVGAGLAVLLAPQSGQATQAAIRERVQLVITEGQKAAEARRLDLTQQLEALKKPASKE